MLKLIKSIALIGLALLTAPVFAQVSCGTVNGFVVILNGKPLCSGASAGVSVPPQAAAQGYNSLTFTTTTFNTTNVDKNYTKATNFQWYPYNFNSVTPPQSGGTVTDLSFPGDGSIKFAGSNNAEISTAVSLSNADFKGTAFGGGGYFEITASFAAGTTYGSNHPSYWFQTLEGSVIFAATTCSFAGFNPTKPCYNWPNQGANYEHLLENDAMEYYGSSGGMGAAFHESFGVYNVTCPPYCKNSTTTAEMPHYAIGAANVALPHKYGMLWVPATATSNGFTAYYFDGNLMNYSPVWAQFPIAQNGVSPYIPANLPPVGSTNPSWRFGVMDIYHTVPIVGAGSGGVGAPMYVYAFNVWQKNATNNVHK